MKNRIKSYIGNRLVDRSVVPYISNTVVSGVAYGLKPSTTSLSVYFDGEEVQTNLRTDAAGTCSFSFTIPPGKFLAGAKLVRISDSPNPYNSTTSAEALYHCSGILEQRSSGSYSTRPPELRRLTTTSEAIAKDPFNRNIDSIESTSWTDPLAQTFFVDKKTNPTGVFVESVSLYFSAKDSSLPVAVQIRPTISGYPSPSVVIPFSTVVKMPDDVKTGATPKSTVFKFSSPIYLEPGEYALCVISNSSEYELFAADTAINAVGTTESTSGRAGNNQLVGTLYTPQGVGPCAANNTTDVMFTMNKCRFSSNGSIIWNTSNCVNTQIIKIVAPEVIPQGCSISRRIGTVNGSVKFENNQSIYLNSLFAAAPTVTQSLVRGADFDVSPVIDVGAICGISVKMYRNSQPSSYLSRVVELPEDLSSNGIAAFLDSNLPRNSSINVYYRHAKQGEAEIFDKPWILMTRKTPVFTSSSEIDFREVEYRAEVVNSTLFQSYQIRVDLLSAPVNPKYSETPCIRNIRTISYRK